MAGRTSSSGSGKPAGKGRGRVPPHDFGSANVSEAANPPARPTRIGADAYPTMIGPGTDYDFTRIPNAEHYEDHAPIAAFARDPLRFRDLLVCTIPSHVMEHHAKGWDAIAIRQGKESNIGVLTMLSFFLNAVYQARLRRNNVRTWIEVILCDHGDQPVCYGSMAKKSADGDLPVRLANGGEFARNKIAGYRIWAMLGYEAGPETLMRSALFDIQLSVNMIDESVHELKQRFLIDSDPVSRQLSVEAYIFKRASDNIALRNKKGVSRKPAGSSAAKKRKKKLVDDEASEADESYDSSEDASQAAAIAAANEAAAEVAALELKIEIDKMATIVYRAIRDEPPGEITRQYSNLQVSGRSMHHRSVAMLEQYVQKVVGSAHMLSGVYSQERIDNACERVRGEWKEGVSLPEGDEFMSARESFSFEMSCASLLRDDDGDGHRRPDAERPSPIQLEAAAYGLTTDKFHFPLPYCAWVIHPTALAPEEFLRQLFIWKRETFEEALNIIETKVNEQERQKLAILQSSAPSTHCQPGATAASNIMRSLSTKASPAAMSHNRSDEERALMEASEARTKALLQRMRAPSGGVKRPQLSIAEAAAQAAAVRAMEIDKEVEKASDVTNVPPPTDAAEFNAADAFSSGFRDMDLNHIYVSEAEFLSSTDGRRKMEIQNIQNGLKPTADKYQELWKRSVKAIERLEPDEEVSEADFSVHKYMMQCDLQRQMRTELFDEVMGALALGVNISDTHRSMFNSLTQTGRIQHILKASPVPNMSNTAAMLVGQMMDLAAGVGVQVGSAQFHVLSDIIPLQTSALEQRDGPLHTNIVGMQGDGKSLLASAAIEAAARDSIVPYDHSSALAEFSGAFGGGHGCFNDDAKTIISDQSVLAQAKNPDERARQKQNLTTGQRHAQRLVLGQDGHSDMSRTRKEWVKAEVSNMNRFKVDVDSDLAPVTRVDILTCVREVRTAVRIGDRITDPNAEARRARWKEICKSEEHKHAVNLFLVLAARCGLVRNVCVDLLRIMQSNSMTLADKYVPSFLANPRLIQRQLEYGSLSVFLTAFHAMFRSESSPLIQMLQDLSGVHSISPAYVSQLPALMEPYLCANAEHGLMMITRMVVVGYPLEHFRVLRLVAGRAGRFKRRTMQAVFISNGVRTAEDAMKELMRERGDTEPPMYVQTLLKTEREIDMRTDARFGEVDMPIFSSVNNSGASGSAYRKNKRYGRGVGAEARSGSGSMLIEARRAEVPYSNNWCDPNYVEIGYSQEHAIREALKYLDSDIHVNAQTLATIFDLTNLAKVRHPVFERAPFTGASCPASALRFERDPVDPKGRAILYREDPITKVENGRYHILVHALMLPPQILLFLMLCSSDNEHTREREAIIPLHVETSPDLFYRHTIKKRPGKLSFSIISASSGIARQRMKVQHGASPFIDKISQSHRIFEGDPEKEVFAEHMRKTFLAPSYAEFVEILNMDPQTAAIIKKENLELAPGAKPTAKQYNFMFNTWVETHPARPGVAEERAKWLYKESSMFAPSKDLLDKIYPQTEIVETLIQSTIMRAERSGDIFYLPRGAPYPLDSHEFKILRELDTCKKFVRSLRWKMVSDWHADCLKHFKTGDRRATIENLFSGRGAKAVPLLAIAAKPGHSSSASSGALVLPKHPIQPDDAARAELALFESGEDGDYTLCDLFTPHLDFLDQYYAYRSHFSKISLSLLYMTVVGWDKRPGWSVPVFTAIDIIRAQEFSSSDCAAEMLPIYRNKLRDAKARDKPVTAGRRSLLSDEECYILAVYKTIRHWTRSMRASAAAQLYDNCKMAVQFERSQNAIVSNVIERTSLERGEMPSPAPGEKRTAYEDPRSSKKPREIETREKSPDGIDPQAAARINAARDRLLATVK